MGRRFGKAWLVAVATAIATWCAAGTAYAIDYGDILGNWCSTTARLEFSRDTMGVFLFSDRSHLSRPISNYEFKDNYVVVHWYLDGKLTSSTFGEFTSDGRTMFLQPGDDVPRRQYKRC